MPAASPNRPDGRPCGLWPFFHLTSFRLSRGEDPTPSARLVTRKNVSQFFIPSFFNSLLGFEAPKARSIAARGIAPGPMGAVHAEP